MYCARLVALGYSQVPRVDFTENYAPVINDITMRTMLVIMNLQGWKGEIIDVEMAFLYGELKEKIYMTIPKGLNEFKKKDLSKEFLVFNKLIYGLVQAARAWWKKFICSLELIGFQKCLVDNCLMKRSNKNGTVMLCIYVDNVCCTGEENAITKAIVLIIF